MFSSAPTSPSQKLQVKKEKGLSPPTSSKTSPQTIDRALLFEKNSQEKKESVICVEAPPHSRQSIYLISIHETCCMLVQNFLEGHYKHNPYFLNRMRMNPDNILEQFKEDASSFGASDLNYQSLYGPWS